MGEVRQGSTIISNPQSIRLTSEFGLTGNNSANADISLSADLSDLSDVSSISPADGDVLQYYQGSYYPASIGAGTGITITSVTPSANGEPSTEVGLNNSEAASAILGSASLTDLSDVGTGASDGQVLKYDATAQAWSPADDNYEANTDNNIGNSNLTLSADRTITCTSRQLKFFYPTDIIVTDQFNNISHKFDPGVAGAQAPSTELKGIVNVKGSHSSAPGQLDLFDNDSTHHVGIKAPATISTSYDLTLPAADGTGGQVLQTNGSGQLSFVDQSSGGGGYDGPIPMHHVSGRWIWSSADDGERVMTGSTAYGPSNWYSHSSEPSNSTLRVYNSSHVANSTSGTMAGYYCFAFGHRVPTDDKKVRIDFDFRLQNAPASSTWGFSVWSANAPTSGNATQTTWTLRGETTDITHSSNLSTRFYHGSFTTVNAVSDDYILVLAENRSGSLTSTTYMYGAYHTYLVD